MKIQPTVFASPNPFIKNINAILIGVAMMIAFSNFSHAQIDSRFQIEALAQTADQTADQASKTEAVMVPRLVGYSDRPIFELIPHEPPPPGFKIFVAHMPVTEDGRLKDERASIRFHVKRTTDACNRVQLQGTIEELTVPTANVGALKLSIPSHSITRTLKSCMNREKFERPVEITTPLSEPVLLRDNAVIYLPTDVDVTVEYWSPKN